MPVPAAAPFRISRETLDKTDSFRAQNDCFHAPSQTKTRGPLARGVPNSIAKSEEEKSIKRRRSIRYGHSRLPVVQNSCRLQIQQPNEYCLPSIMLIDIYMDGASPRWR